MLYQKYHNTITKLKNQDLWDRSKLRLLQSNLNMDNNSDKSTSNPDITPDINGTIQYNSFHD